MKGFVRRWFEPRDDEGVGGTVETLLLRPRRRDGTFFLLGVRDDLKTLFQVGGGEELVMRSGGTANYAKIM